MRGFGINLVQCRSDISLPPLVMGMAAVLCLALCCALQYLCRDSSSSAVPCTGSFEPSASRGTLPYCTAVATLAPFCRIPAAGREILWLICECTELQYWQFEVKVASGGGSILPAVRTSECLNQSAAGRSLRPACQRPVRPRVRPKSKH